MKFSKFAEYLQLLEETSKRLEITEILKNLINELDASETRNAVNLALGQLQAPFESQRFNIADKMVIRTLAHTYQITEEVLIDSYRKLGDLGDVAQQLADKTVSSDLEINQVHKALTKVAELEGTGSQEKKVFELALLIKQLSPLSTKYVLRIILGTTRLGFTSLTIIDAISKLLAGDKSLKDLIESKYNVHPDIALITQLIKQGGIEELDNISMQPGVPLMPQKPQRLDNTEETVLKMGGRVIAEYKFDGTRVQLHMDRKKKIKYQTDDLFESNIAKSFIKTYTRNLDDSTHQFPDITEAAEKYIKADSIIFDGEAIAYNKETGNFLPFQETIQRKRKHGIENARESIPLKYLVFDILYLNGKEVYLEPYEERRELLKDVITQNETILIDEHIDTSDPHELEEYFLEAKSKSLEGLVVKNPHDAYQAGARSFSWVKLKRLEGNSHSGLTDTVELVVIGYFYGQGTRAKFGIGGILGAIYDKEQNIFKTITKVGSGFTDDGWRELKSRLEKFELQEMPSNVEVQKEMFPDVWVNPKVVIEVLADEISISKLHTAGYALRFPRFLKYRDDKDIFDITSLKEIKEIAGK